MENPGNVLDVVEEITTTVDASAQAVGDKMGLLGVVLLGIGIVFVGLICLIVLVTILGKVVKPAKEQKVASSAAPALAAASEGAVTPQMVAAVSAVLAEEMGTDISGIRIRSFKRV